MFVKTYRMRSTAAAVAAVLWGMAPLGAQALGATQTDAVIGVTAPAGTGCGVATGGPGRPFTIAAEPRSELVKDAPFSGVGTTEVVTTLADGNRIVRTNTMKYYRDSRGRTRTEYSLAAIGPFTPDQAQSVVTITDPTEGKRYVLHSAMKRADIFPAPEFGKFPKPGVPADDASNAATAKSSGIRTGGMTARGVGGGNVMYGVPSFSTRGGPAPRGVPAGGAAPAAAAIGPPVVTMSTTTALPGAGPGFIMQYSAPMMIASAGPTGCSPDAKPLPAPTSLGERIIEGLKVTGTRMQFTIEAGAVGNEQPIVVSSDQWFSPDLGVVVESTHRDPMMGDTKYTLANISRAEPEASLFTIPADYTQTDLSKGGNGVFFESGVTTSPDEPPPPPGSGPNLRLRMLPPKP